MKSFKQFLNEETMPYAGTAKGIINIENSSVRDGLNSQLAGVTTGKFVTPYIALERVSKALANFHIFIPRHSFLEGDSGMLVWPINQFGIKFGQQNDGTFVQDGEVLKDTSKGIHPEGEDNKVVSEPNKNVEKPFSVIFEYRQSDCGMFNIFCEVITQEELDEILSDLEDEMNDDDDEEDLNEGTVDEACWEGYRKDGMKKMFGKMYPNCVKVDEEDQLDETSDEKKKEYAGKAIPSKAGADFEMGKNRNPFSPEYKKASNTSRKRDAGLRRLIRSTVKEEKFTNRVPSENPYGNLDAAKKEMNKPKPVPTRNTKDLDNRNRDAEDNTVVEGNKENKEKKKEALIKSSGKKNLRDVRAQMKDRVNRDFDPRALKVMEEENLDEVTPGFIRKEYLPKARPQLAKAKSALLASKSSQAQDKLMKFIKKRGRGVSRAENKLTKGVMSQFNQNIKDTFSPEKVAKLFAAQKASQKAEMKDKKEK
jgi:hypothetical protein